MAISKVDFGDETLIDLTSDTVTAEALVAGYTATGADGEKIAGTLNPDEYVLKTGDTMTGNLIINRRSEGAVAPAVYLQGLQDSVNVQGEYYVSSSGDSVTVARTKDGTRVNYMALKDDEVVFGKPIQGVMNYTLLWTNASPTSSFGAQTLTLGLGSYDGYLILSKSEATETDCYFSTGFIPTGLSCYLFGLYTGNPHLLVREVTYSDGNLVFGASALYAPSAGGNPAKAIPYKIYGIKGVS